MFDFPRQFNIQKKSLRFDYLTTYDYDAYEALYRTVKDP